jgi:hypothetical protein
MYHVISNSYYMNRAVAGDMISRANLLIPGKVSCTDADRVQGTLPHVRVVSQQMAYFDDTSIPPEPLAPTNKLDEELAYVSDINRSMLGYVGLYVPTVGAVAFRKLCKVTFVDPLHSQTGAMFGIAWSDPTVGGADGLLSVSIGDTALNARVITMNTRLANDSNGYMNAAHDPGFMLYVQPSRSSSEVSFTLWASAGNNGEFVSSLKLLTGAAYVEYYDNTALSGAEAVRWEYPSTHVSPSH